MLLGLASVVIGYLLGAIPAAYIVAKQRKGIDIREVGVRNMGGANVLREVGKWEGSLVLIVDMGKGALSVYIAQLLGVSYLWVLAAGFAAMLGHNYPVYIGFRGGKGIATVMGIFFALSPVAMGITTLIIGFILLFARSYFVAIAITAPFFLLVVWWVEGSAALIFYALAIVAFQLFRSRRRLEEVRIITARRVEELKGLARKVKG